MRLREDIGRLGLKLLFYPKYDFKFTYKDFDPKRKDPYFLIANHPSLNDPLYTEIKLINYPYPVASNILYTNPFLKFLLQTMSTSIPKRKGQSDVQTIRSIINAFQKDHRGIMIFPEGNSSFFGEQSNVSYLSTAKLVKKINKEVIVAKIRGGYLSSPRWGKRRKKGHYHIHYEPLLSVQQLKQMTLHEIEVILEQAIQFNDYDWNREHQMIYHSNHKAEGLEQYIYACPKCEALQTISSKGNNVYCSHCGKIAQFNPYGFIEGLPFDNLIPWDKLQKKRIPFAIQSPITSKGKLYEVDFIKYKRYPQGDFNITLKDRILELSNLKQQHIFHVDQIVGIVLTQRNFLSFDYYEKTYLIRISDPMLIMDAIKYIKGE